MSGRDYGAFLFGPEAGKPPAAPAGKDYGAFLFGSETAPPAASAPADTSIAPAKPAAPEARPEDQSVFRQFADVPLKASAGVVTGVRMIADVFGADSAVSKNLKGAEDWIAELYSAQSKQDSKRMAQIMKEAEDKGVAANVAAAVKAFQVAPVDLVVNSLGTAAPAIMASVAAFVLGAPTALATAAALGTGAAMGTGTIKGAIYEATKQNLQEQKGLNLSPAQIEKIATDAQSYGGGNLDMILTGAIISAAGARTGAERIIAKELASKIAGEAAKKGATETALAALSKQSAEQAAKRGIVKQAGIAGATEFGTEFLQGGQEQLAQNLALQRQGYDVPTMRGVVGQGTLEGLAGFGMGAIAGGREAYSAKREFYRDQPSTKAGEDAIRDTVFTTAGEDKQRAPVAPSADDVNLIMPATDASGKPLTTAASESTEAKGRVDAEAAAAEQTQQQKMDAARAYVDKVDAGEKPNQKIINAFGKDLGIKFPQAIKSNVAKLNFIREHLAQQGAPSGATTAAINTAGGAGAGMAGQPSTVGPAAGPVPSGVVPAGAATTATATGAGAQPGAVTLDNFFDGLPNELVARLATDPSISPVTRQAATQELQKRQAAAPAAPPSAAPQKFSIGPKGELIPIPAAPAATKKSAVQADRDELDSLFGDDESSLSARRTDAEITRDQKMDQIGRRFGLSRSADETAQQFRARIKEAMDFEEMREGKPLSEISEQDIAKQTLREDGSYVPPDLQIEAYEEARKIHNDQLGEDEQDQRLPAYKELSADDRRVYFQEGLPRPGAGTAAQHAAAAQKLAEYRSGVKEEAEPYQLRDKETGELLFNEDGTPMMAITTLPGENRARESYNRERGEFGRKTGLSYAFPAWNTLSQESKRAYIAVNKTDSLAEQYLAFSVLKKQIQKEKAEEARTAALTQAETDATRQMLDAAARARKSQPAGKGDFLPDSILKKLLAGDITAVLDYIKEHGNGLKPIKYRESPTGKRMKLYNLEGEQIQIRNSIAMEVFRNLAARLLDVEGLKVNVVYDENMVYDQIARYDANTNTMYVGPNGLDEATVLHELLHAATVKIIHQFYTDASKLSAHARKAVEHLIQIAAMAKSRLGSNPQFAGAFENLYEFVAYSQTDMDFQHALAQEQVGSLATITAKYRIVSTGDSTLRVGQIVNKNQLAALRKEFGDEFSVEPVGEQTELAKQRESKEGAKMYDAFMDNLWNAYTGTLAYLYKLFKPGQTTSKFLFLVPTFSGEDIKNKVQNPGKGLTGKAREDAIAAFNKKLREEKEKDIQRKGEEKKAFEKKLKKAIQEIEDGAAETPLTEADKFYQAIGKLEKERKLTANEKAAFDIEGLFEKEGEEYEAKIPDIDDAQYVPYERGITNLKRGILREPGFKGNLLLEASEMVSMILEAPEGNIERLAGKEGIDSELYATRTRRAAPAPAPTPPLRSGGVNDPEARKDYALSTREKILTAPRRLWNTLTTAPGWREIVRRFQDKSVEIRSLQRKLDMAGLINRNMDEAFNNSDDHRVIASTEARNFVDQYLRVPMDNLKQLVGDYAKASKKKLDDVMIDLHMFAEMFHEPERRFVSWVTTVPLSTVKNITSNGKLISAAQRRVEIMGDPRTGKAGIIHRVELTEAQQRQLWAELTSLAENYKDAAGDSPRIKSDRMRKRVSVMETDINSRTYNMLGIDQNEVNLRMQEYKALPDEQREILDKVFEQAREITKISAELDKIGNYWSFPVSNLVGMYGYQHYLPFKGISKNAQTDVTGFNSRATGRDMQDTPFSADGRFTASDNPILQMMSDAFRAAGRAGRRNYSQSIKNSVKPNKYNPTGTGVIDGEVVAHIEHAERSVTDMKQYQTDKNIFVYNKDGSTDVIYIKDPKILAALRYSFRDASPMWDMANSVTGFFGAMHTRYNYNFAPLNFVRDLLTNAWTMGAELGPLKSAQYIKQISAAVVKNGLGKAMEVAILHDKGDPVSRRMLADMASKDPFVRDMIEYLQRGKTTYLQSFSLKSNLHDLNTKLGKRRIMDKVDQFNEFVDIWNNMFEFTSRTAAFSLRKQELVKKNIAKGMSESAAYRAAVIEAAAWTKNLANFENAGEYAREMGALYMFIRASATGAVRAGEATLPAFRTLNSAVNDLPASIRDNEPALEQFKANYKKQQRNAQIMTVSLFGAGMFLFWMSSVMAPDDEWKRNNVKTDNMAQWTRSVRFHIPDSVSEKLGIGKDVVFQMPWGFGLGAFAAFGAQVAGLAVGAQSFKEFVGNSITTFADSFLPLPLSKIPPTESVESAGKWALDTVAPTAIRPLFEFYMNTNGIGQTINSAATRRMGDAYTGGDRIPEMYKDAADYMYTASLGKYDVSPNTLYFLANSYLDGLAKVAQTVYSWASLDRGEKAFNIKTDVPLFGSFFGAKVNVDSREYGEMERKILEMDKRLNTLKKERPEYYPLYLAENPLDAAIVDAYRKRQGELNKLRAEAKEIRTMRGISPKDREELLRIATMQQNMLKHRMVQDFKAFGMER